MKYEDLKKMFEQARTATQQKTAVWPVSTDALLALHQVGTVSRQTFHTFHEDGRLWELGDEALLTTSQVAVMLCVSPSTVVRWAKTGKLPCVKTGGRHRRFRVKNLRHYMKTKTTREAILLA